MSKRCRKHRNHIESCTDCRLDRRYGKYGQMRNEDNPRDLTDDLKIRMGFKLVKGFNMLKEDNY